MRSTRDGCSNNADEARGTAADDDDDDGGGGGLARGSCRLYQRLLAETTRREYGVSPKYSAEKVNKLQTNLPDVEKTCCQNCRFRQAILSSLIGRHRLKLLELRTLYDDDDSRGSRSSPFMNHDERKSQRRSKSAALFINIYSYYYISKSIFKYLQYYKMDVREGLFAYLILLIHL